ncbi:PRK06851 family protein [Sediminibacillus massiliensis]|uniref:PRK06851 family protein n=1 Tax=Sediminibacillus massiliensis TaxID=1926277 RepID=UPI000988325A|nr:PRK06851 family protein [Sediminibacillus massiliensis]
MRGKAINFYAGGNTAKGFYSLFDSSLEGLESVFLLKGGPGTGKSTMIKKLGDEWQEKGYDVELIHCASDNDSLDGLIIPALKFGIFDGTAPHILEPKAPGAAEQYVNLGLAWDTAWLSGKREDILHLQDDIEKMYKKAYQSFEDGLRVHDDLEEIYIAQLDFAKANQLTEELIAKIFQGSKERKREARTKHRFLGAATPEGAVDFIPNLTEGTKRYFLKGRAGTGKSTLLKKIAAAGTRYGFDVEVYHCGFDPESLDMVVIRELEVSVFDSTAPHEYAPSRHGDEIIDLYEKTVEPGTDEKYEARISEVTKRYKQHMNEGIAYLKEAKKLHDRLEQIYLGAIDFSIVDEMYDTINTAITDIADRN